MACEDQMRSMNDEPPVGLGPGAWGQAETMRATTEACRPTQFE